MMKSWAGRKKVLIAKGNFKFISSVKGNVKLIKHYSLVKNSDSDVQCLKAQTRCSGFLFSHGHI